MDPQVAARLVALNYTFYQRFGWSFSQTRQDLQPGVRRVLDHIKREKMILDLGCGNGNLGRALYRLGHEGRYVGLDFSLPLLQMARQGLPANFLFFLTDLSAPDWGLSPLTNHLSPPPAEILAPASYDLICCFATLHHIPGHAFRMQVLEKIAFLLRPGGHFIHSEWLFLRSERMRKRIQPWEEVGLSPAELEPGDYLLDWRSGGRGLRYVHHFTEAELAEMAQAVGLQVVEEFYSDGREGDLSLYQIWGRPS